MKATRKNYNTNLRVDLIKRLKFLAVEKDARINNRFEEANDDLLEKYGKDDEE